MIDVDVNSERVKSSGYDIISLANEYREAINAIYEKIFNLSETDTWVGRAALEYISKAREEKASFDNIGNTLNNYGRMMVANAEEYESFANRCNYYE